MKATITQKIWKIRPNWAALISGYFWTIGRFKRVAQEPCAAQLPCLKKIFFSYFLFFSKGQTTALSTLDKLGMKWLSECCSGYITAVYADLFFGNIIDGIFHRAPTGTKAKKGPVTPAALHGAHMCSQQIFCLIHVAWPRSESFPRSILRCTCGRSSW